MAFVAPSCAKMSWIRRHAATKVAGDPVSVEWTGASISANHLMKIGLPKARTASASDRIHASWDPLTIAAAEEWAHDSIGVRPF
jgi:hypothetical protein